METVIHMGWTSMDKMLIAVPLFHCFGITSGLLSSIHSGCIMHLIKYFKTQKVLEHIERYGCTVLNGVPSMFLAMIRNSNYKDYNVLSLQSGIIAGSPLSPQEYISICNTISNIRLHQSYGQTETSPCVSIIDTEDSCEKKTFSTGRIISHAKVRIVDINTKEPMEANWIGEIQVQGYNVMQGYYKLPEENEHAISRDGWLKTGDLGYLDVDGYLYITGRLKEMIIRGGENISPQEIENCLKECPNIQNVKVVGIPTEVLQEMIVACVIMEQGFQLKEELIKSHLSSKLAYYKIPAYILNFETFPMNTSGKIKIPELKQQVIKQLHQEQKEEDLLCFSQNNII
jgi:fatty-acyl-CoA synthase